MYCSPAEVLKEMYLPLQKQLLEHFTVEGELEAFLETHIRKASAYIDSLLGARFQVPVSAPFPHAVVSATAQLASFYATANFSEQDDISKDKRDNALAMISALLRTRSFPGLLPLNSFLLQGKSDPRVYPEEVTGKW